MTLNNGMTDPIDPYSLSLNTLVELKGQYADVYPASPAGARGWVRGKRQFPQTDPEIYIEWDKKHWRYMGEPDGWTFEHHFRPVDDALFNEPNLLSEAAKAPRNQPCPDCGGIHDTPDAFLDELLGAQEAAINSDGYLIITIAPHKEGGLTVYQPELFSRSLTPTARKIIEGQIILIASELLQNHVQDRLEEMGEE